jgi:hypothetical protein
LREFAFVRAAGILIGALFVRSLLVPALLSSQRAQGAPEIPGG